MQHLLKLLPQSLSKKIVAVPSWLRASSLLLVCLSLLLSGGQPALAGLLEDLTDGRQVRAAAGDDRSGTGLGGAFHDGRGRRTTPVSPRSRAGAG